MTSAELLLRRAHGVFGLARENLVFFAQVRNEGVIAIDRLVADISAYLASLACDKCGCSPVVAELDGDQLCQPCADKWCRAEGEAAQ